MTRLGWLAFALALVACDESRGSDAAIVRVGEPVLFDGTTRMAPGLEPTWVLEDRPESSSLTLEGSATVTVTFEADVAGSYQLVLYGSSGPTSAELFVVFIAAVP